MLAGTLNGNLGGDAKVESTTSGSSLLKFSVAVSQQVGKEKQTTWVTCAWWGDHEKMTQYLKKGAGVVVLFDQLTTRIYEGKIYTDVRVSKVDITKFVNEDTSTSNDDDYDTDHRHPLNPDDIPF